MQSLKVDIIPVSDQNFALYDIQEKISCKRAAHGIFTLKSMYKGQEKEPHQKLWMSCPLQCYLTVNVCLFVFLGKSKYLVFFFKKDEVNISNKV